jgi:hypothetical protein
VTVTLAAIYPCRPIPRRTAFLAALGVCAAVLLTTACGAKSGPAPAVSLSALVAAPERWQGERIEVRGRLLRFDDPDRGSYGVIEDGEENRVGLKAISKWQSLVGQDVVATGKLEFDDAFGWYLAGPSVDPAPS